MSGVSSVSIMGEGVINGGEYEKIKVNGEAVTTGNIKCETLKVNGECNIKEELRAGTIKVRGEVAANKVVYTENLNVTGEVSFADECYLDDVHIVGEAKYEESVNFTNYKGVGEICAYKDFEGQNFEYAGEVDIKGLLSADNITIKVKGRSFINEVGGTNISIFDKYNVFAKRGIMKCNLIEGDEVEIENTIADVVRGINVKILKGSKVNRVEYSGTIEIDKDSIVKEKVCQKN